MEEESVLFNSLNLTGWRQFRDIDIDFHPRLTILTGANGAGKSTLLKIMKCHFAHESDEQFLATPVKDKQSTKFSLGSWVASGFDKIFPRKNVLEGELIGSIAYTNGTTSSLTLPSSSTILYALKRDNQVIIPGVNISSHRVLPRYEEIKQFSITGTKPAEAYKDFFEIEKSYNLRNAYFRDGHHRNVNPVAAIKEALISFATFGVGNVHVTPVPELVGLYEQFQLTLKNILPSELGFQKLDIRTPEVVIVTSSGDFPIDGASGGIMSIIQLAWQIFLQSRMYDGKQFMVLIDEPENHLHPSMQRTFLARVLEAFPNARFVIATHSPFIVSSVEDSHVYALRHHTASGDTLHPLEPRSVVSVKLDHLNMAGPASDILREVLGVPVTMPQWSAERLEQIAAEFAEEPLEPKNLERLRKKLREAGLNDFYPYALERLVK